MNHQLTHNKTYAHRLPPTLIEQARHWANFHEQGVFSDTAVDGIGNSAFQIRFSLYLILADRRRCSRWTHNPPIDDQFIGAYRLRWRPSAVPS
jgi:hypothetical protein